MVYQYFFPNTGDLLDEGYVASDEMFVQYKVSSLANRGNSKMMVNI